ncbi:hypothetical protein Tco_0926228, partial [Tanacetum coccineum]
FSHVRFGRITYMEVSSPFEGLSDIGSPRVDDHEYLELPWMLEDPYVEAALQAPSSPDYVPGPEEPEQAPPFPDYVLGPEHVDDEIVVEDQPYAKDASPTAQSPDYVPESDPKADPEEDDDEDPEEDPVNYPADGGDDGDDEDEPSEEDEDDDVDIEADEDEEKEEHPAPADSVVVALLAADQAPSADETEPFETDESAATPPPHPAYRVTAMISIPALVPVPAWSNSKVARLLAISTPPSSPLSPWSSPLPQIPSPPLPSIPSPSLPVSPPLPVSSPVPVLSLSPPVSPIRSLVYRAAMIRLRAEAASTSYSLPLPHPSYSPTLDQPEVTLPPRKRLGIALGPAYEVGESSSAAAARPTGGLRADYGFVTTMDREIRRDSEREIGYGITDSWDEIVETLQGAPVSTDMELGRHMTAFETRVRQDTDEIYTRLTRKAWRRSMDVSDLARGEVMSLRTTILGQMSEIRELHAADRRRQAVTSEMLKADHRRSAEIRELRTVDRTRQQQLIQTLTVMQSLQGQKMAPKRATRSTPVTTTPAPTATTTTSVTNAQLQAMIDQGVTAALAARDANRNGDDSHTSGTGGRRTERIVRECTYQDFMKCSNMVVDSHVYAGQDGSGGVDKIEVSTIAERQTETKGSFVKNIPETIKTNKNRNRGRTLAKGPITAGTGERKPTRGVWEMPTMLTIKGAPGQARNLLALSWKFQGTSEECQQLKTTKTPWKSSCFDAIIGMDWLAKYQAIIVCAEKIVRIPWGNETLIVHGDGSNRGHEARLHIISYSKTQEYMLKGCPLFLAHVTTNEVEDKSEKKRLEDVPIV